MRRPVYIGMKVASILRPELYMIQRDYHLRENSCARIVQGPHFSTSICVLLLVATTCGFLPVALPIVVSS